ncbi:MAG: DMT family transporter [Granulosicoccus sp.]
MNTTPARGIALILCAAFLWGTTGTAQSFAPLTLSSYWVGTMRLLVSAIFFILWLGLSDISIFKPSQFKSLPWFLISAAALTMAIYNLAFFAGIRATSVAIGTAVALGSSPVWAGIIQAIGTRQIPARAWWLAVTVALSGLLVATLGSIPSEAGISILGIGLCLLSGLSYAIYAIVTKQLVSKASASVTTTMVFTGAALFALPCAFVLAGSPIVNRADVAVMLWLGIIATGVAYLLFSLGLRFVSSATGVALALAEPIAAVILAIVIVGERPGPIALTGLAMVFIGLCLIVRSELESQPRS